jgi:hypothetical protein
MFNKNNLKFPRCFKNSKLNRSPKEIKTMPKKKALYAGKLIKMVEDELQAAEIMKKMGSRPQPSSKPLI